jgi:DNA invertase Pin-like site-specific DNA recombinase
MKRALSLAELEASLHSCAASRRPGRYLRVKPLLTKSQALDARRFLLDGEPPSSVTRALGMTKTTLYKIFKHYNIATPAKLDPSFRNRRITAGLAESKRGGGKLGVPPKLTEQQVLEAARLISKGKSLVSTARNFDVMSMTLRAALRRHALKPPPCKITEKQAASAARRVAKGESLTRVARSLGVWPVTLINTLRRYGFDSPVPSQPPTRAAT